MPTLAIIIEYDGTNFSGWQIQPNGRTVQGCIETALKKLTSKDYKIIGAGRTDAGVHAKGQCAHTEIDSSFSITENKIAVAINSNLSKDIRIKKATVFNQPFHARFDATAREYSYTIITRESVFNRFFSTYIRYPIDFELLNKSASIFLGEHDFTTYSKLNESTASYICNVSKCLWQKVNDNTFRLQVIADRFVYGMVRALTGAMLEVASKKTDLRTIKQHLEKKERALSFALAPPQGLILEKVYYKDEIMNSLQSCISK